MKCRGVEIGDRMIGDKDDLKMEISLSDEEAVLYDDPTLLGLIGE